MNENNEILTNLIGEEEKTSSNLHSGKGNKKLTDNRIVGARYKFYSIVIALLIFVIGYNYVLPSYESFQLKQMELKNNELQLSSFQNKRIKYEANIGLVDTIKNVEEQVVTCLNTLQGCKELPDLIKSNFSVVRSYLLLTEMNNNKMSLDERKILANIDSFLLKKNPLNENSMTINGILNKISIGEKEKFNENLYFVPIELGITFDDKDGLLSFIDNVEKKIPKSPDLRMLYKIDKINYDIVNYDEPQETNIFMYLYFYDNKSRG